METEHGRFSGGQIALAFVLGALSGVAVALLTAPMSGKDTRMHIGRFAVRSKEKIAGIPKAVRERFGHDKDEEIEEGV